MDTFVGILAIGNEVTDGQILNRNASWLAAELEKMGAKPRLHMTCRDHNDDILASLDHLAKYCQLIITTGGLGPTKDDFTKECLAQWLGLELCLNEEQWTCIKYKLNNRNVTLRDGHKRQAMLPKASIALDNKKGVAPGFFANKDSLFLACLPGPPNELQPMFLEGLKPLIEQHLKPQNDKRLKTWICLGAPESEVAHIVESLIGDQVDVGFRIHKPFVEVKLWLSNDDLNKLSTPLKRMEEKLSPWLVAKSIDEIRNKFHGHLKTFQNVFIIDHLTSGLFLERFQEMPKMDHIRYQCFEHKSFRYFTKSELQQIIKHMGIGQSTDQLFISLFPASDSSAFVAMNDEIQEVKTIRNVPLQSQLGLLSIIEKIFLH